MRNMRISANEKVIEMEFTTVQNARKLYDSLLKHEQDRCVLHGTYITYDLTDVQFSNIILVVRNLFCKSFQDGRIKDDHIAIGNEVLQYTEAVTTDKKLFRITLSKQDGTIGEYGFGCWQYGRILSLKDTTDSFEITLRNSNLDENVHKITYTEKNDVLIEIGEIQF